MIFLKNDYYYGAFWLGVIVVIFFLPIIFGQQSLFQYESTVFSTPSGQFYNLPGLKTGWVWGGTNLLYIEAPQTIIGLEFLRNGNFPLWSHFSAAGYPLAGALISGFYYPLKFIVFYFFPYLGTFNFYFILRLFLAGLGMFLFLKSLSLSRRSALIGGVAYMLSGHFVINILNWWLNIAVVLPYALYTIERYFQSWNKRYIGLSAILFALLILGGQPQSTIISSLLIGAYFVYRWLMKGYKKYWRSILLFVGISFPIVILICLPMLIDFFVFFSQSITVHTNDPQVFKYFSWSQLLYFFVSPTMFLELALFGRIAAASNPVIFQYLSIVVWLLVIVGFCVKQKHSVQYFFLGYLIFDFLKIMGVPPISWISHLPLFNMIFWLEHDSTFVFSLAVLAAFGYEKVTREEIYFKPFVFLLGLIVGVFFTVIVLFKETFFKLYLPIFDLSIRRPGPLEAFQTLITKLPLFLSKAVSYFLNQPLLFVFSLFGTVFLLVLLTVFFLWRLQRKKSIFFANAIIVLLVLELFIYLPKIRDGFFRPFNPFPKHPAVAFLQEKIGSEPVRFIGGKDTIQPQTGAIFGLQDFRTNEALTLKRYDYFANEFLFLSHLADFKKISKRSTLKPDIFVSNTFAFDESDYQPQLHRFFDMANIRYIVTEQPLVDDDLEEVFRVAGLIVYENKTVLPRMYLVDQVRTVNSLRESIQLLGDDQFNYRESIVIDGDYPELANLSFKKNSFSALRIDKYSSREIVATVNTVEKKFLVLTDAYYPGWRAYIDGQETRIYPTNTLFRSILIPAGIHKIVFSYQPLWFFPSVFLSFLGLVGALYLMVRKF